MRLKHGLHLAYCTNIHRGEDWPQTFEALERYTLPVKGAVCPDKPYAIGLRLSDKASRELLKPDALRQFRGWLAAHNCYIFTINGFPFGQFHGARVKEQVYVPDWTADERVTYTCRLFDLLAELVPDGVEGSVSTVPGSFKEFITTPEQVASMRTNLWRTVDYVSDLCARTGKVLHLGLEPEPLCYLETSSETVAFLEEMQSDRPKDERWRRYLGVNYDTCHLAVEYEEPAEAIRRFREHGVRISKLHLSSALKVRRSRGALLALEAFADDIYFHQVIERQENGTLQSYRDLDLALKLAAARPDLSSAEWRIHFHIPLHCRPAAVFCSTSDHLLGILDALAADPGLCSHLEMETYTWEVMPVEFKNRTVVDQLTGEYEWVLKELAERELA